MKSRVLLIALWLLCLLASAVAALWMLLATLVGSRRAWRLAVAHDQLINAATGGNEDETVSSRAAKAARDGRRWGCVLCRWLDKIDPGHCEKNIEHNRGQQV